MSNTLIAAIISNLLCTQVYVVQKGDSISSILIRNGNKTIYGEKGFINKVKAINNIKNIDLIYVGQKILIPGDGSLNLDKESSLSLNEQVANKNSFDDFQLTEDELVLLETTEEPGIQKESLPVTTKYSISGEVGTFLIESSSEKGKLVIDGGTNKLTLRSESQQGSLTYTTLVSGNYYILSPEINFAINTKKMILMNYELGISKVFDYFRLGGSVGFNDNIGFFADSVTGLNLSKVLTPYLSIKSEFRFGPGVTLEGAYSHSLQAKTNRITVESGKTYKLAVGKSIYSFSSGKTISAILGYQKSDLKMSNTEDSDTRTTFGVKFEW